MNLINLLASDGYLVINKYLIKTIGINNTIFLTELINEYCYWQNNDKLENDWFYSTVENVENATTLSKFQQSNCVKFLENLELLKSELKGLPCRRYIKLNIDNILNLVNKNNENLTKKDIKQDVKKINVNELNNSTHSSKKILQQTVKKLDTNNNNINNNKNINNKANFSKQAKSIKLLENTLEEYEDVISSNILEKLKLFYLDKIDKGIKISEIQIQMQIEEFNNNDNSEILKAINTAIAGDYKKIYIQDSNNHFKFKNKINDSAHYTEKEKQEINEKGITDNINFNSFVNNLGKELDCDTTE